MSESEVGPLPGVKLGVDVGTVRVGLASCDPRGILATPVRTLNRDTKKNHDVRILVREAQERDVVCIYVGLPRTMSGQERASAQMARSYAQLLVDALLEAQYPVPVRMVDERLSTVTAHQSLQAAGMSSRRHRTVVDQVAAVGILQHALDIEKSRGTSAGTIVTGRRSGALGRAGNTPQAKDGVIGPESVISPERVISPESAEQVSAEKNSAEPVSAEPGQTL
ncbi:Holliday junction resolvase RuvX [Paeniglutamicibacter antarcticus]|uniref:Putative pre-16S rRNA nuclease n=1 Tax=Arthrobacter terrae TaxID=2935737 RepID=A0A931G7C0_9MICC|nr:Holliday junction resolvase RuvX [Arthrobacter terrae]MBG0741595.1 Holliday junction resolvase RuvX [Arthrobacter terrae]